MRLALLVLTLAACEAPHALALDASTPQLDAPQADAAHDASGVPLAGFGDLSGMCGVIQESDLTSASPRTIQVDFNWAQGYVDPDDRPLLTAGGQHMAATPNAGGSSGLSEIFAYEEVARCELATFLKSETEIIYDPPTSIKTDILIMLDGHKIGVSVTRAFQGPLGSGPLTMDAAVTLAQKKFAEIHDSTAGTANTVDKWDKQILSVLADNVDDANTWLAATATLDAATIGDTILVLITTDGDDAFIYTNE
ncbi:MAG TPA: hypothetical protein VGG28_01285 [Kofleriaceae bacterium]